LVDYRVAVERLQAAFSLALPGTAAHDRVAPRPGRDWPAGFDPARARNAAGLLLVFPKGGLAHVLLTVRADSLQRHGGQISLPGGVVEPGETYEQAALREACEEVGLRPEGVRTIGPLTPLAIPVSGFRLHPIVATIDSRPALAPADREVAEILEIAVEALVNPAALTEQERIREGRPVMTPAFEVAGHQIWGATAMVLAEFLTLLGWDAADRRVVGK
jgi:8-oxo-dGTP pyrophosphatase MutT (NUDIX family)